MNLRDLAYLVAVADHRHFGRAADACFVSQPTLSTQIRKLEAELGVTLIERGPRDAMLTPVGEEVVARARSILRDVDQLRVVADRASDRDAGTLRLGAFPTLAPYLLPHIVPAIHRRFPRLELLLVEEKSEELEARLRDGRLDAALLALPVSGGALEVAPLFDEPFVLAVPADHPLADTDGPISTASLRGERLLLLEDGHCLREQALSVCSLAGAAERDGFRATSLETLRQMVASHVGITLLPELAVTPPVPASPAIRLLPFRAPAPSRRIGLLWRTSSPDSVWFEQLAALIRSEVAGLNASVCVVDEPTTSRDLS